MPDLDAELLAAVNAGIEEGSELPHADPSQITDPAGDDTPVDDTSVVDTKVEPETTEVEAEAEKGADGKAMRDEKGRFIKKQPESETPEAKIAREAAEKAALAEKNKGKTPEQIAAEAKATEDAKKAKADPINAPIPADMKKETRERMQSLVKIAKEQTTAATTATENFNLIMDGIMKVGATPEQYGHSLNIIGLINSGDPAKQEQALQLLHSEYTTLAKMLGKPVAGVDMLAGHADLSAEVAAGKLTKERAEELAAMRESSKIRKEQQTQVTTATTAKTAAEQEVAKARADLNAIEEANKARPEWPAIRKHLVAKLQGKFSTMDPKLWASTFQTAIDILPPGFGKEAPIVTKTGGNTPLRARSGTAATLKPAPGSFEEAVAAGIQEGSGR